MWAILISSLIKFAMPLGFLVWSFFQPAIASYVFIGFTVIFIAYLFFIDITDKPRPDSLIWTSEEIRILRTYHLAIRCPFASKDASCYLNGIRLSAFIWVPWLLWNQLWIPAVFLVVNFFITTSLSFRLDPFFFLSEAIRGGNLQLVSEFSILQQVQKKLNSLLCSQPQAQSDILIGDTIIEPNHCAKPYKTAS